AIKRAKEAMGLHLYGMEIDGDEIPNPTPIKSIEYDKTQALILIEIYMPLYREIIDNQAVKKTLTIPRWLNILAEKNKINFSQVLQNALKDILNINSKEIEK
ncbi:type II toxin-antitoxin system HicB family antitoxin, partial [uncultured Clostridium sp.]